MAELTAQRLRELDGNELYAALDNGPDRPLVQAEIRRRELAGLPEAVADALRLLARTPRPRWAAGRSGSGSP